MNEVVVFSGAGALLFAHLGGYQALLEKGIVPEYWVGTSGGAVAALIARLLSVSQQGVTVEDIAKELASRGNQLVTLGANRTLLQRGGFYEGQPLREEAARLITEHFPDGTANTPIGGSQGIKNLAVAAVRVKTLDLVIFGLDGGTQDVPAAQAVRASAAIPVIFEPETIDGEDYIDGGVKAVFPLKAGIMVNSQLFGGQADLYGFHVKEDVGNFPALPGRFYDIALRATIGSMMQVQLDLTEELYTEQYTKIVKLTIPSGLVTLTDFQDGMEVFELGYRQAKSQLA